MGKQRDEKTEESLYRVLTGVLLAALVFYGAIRIFQIDLRPFLLPCVLRTFLGIYCPGCGGTRALEYLLQGQLLKSLYYHPIVLYGAVICGWYWITHTLKHLTKGRIKGMRYRNLYAYLAAVILAINFIWKNFMLIFGHAELIP